MSTKAPAGGGMGHRRDQRGSLQMSAFGWEDPAVQVNQSGWAFVDAWVLTAVATSQQPSSLTALVATADGLNHAILLDAEVDGAMGKCSAADSWM